MFRLATGLVLAGAWLCAQDPIGVIPVVLCGPEENPAWLWSVDEIESWNGWPAEFALARLGPPDEAGELTPPIPHCGALQGLQARLDGVSPDHGDAVRVLSWHREGVNTCVFLFRRQSGAWTILDAVAWADGVEF